MESSVITSIIVIQLSSNSLQCEVIVSSILLTEERWTQQTEASDYLIVPCTDLRIDAEVHAETVNCPLKLLTAVFVVPPGCGLPEKMLSPMVCWLQEQTTPTKQQLLASARSLLCGASS